MMRSLQSVSPLPGPQAARSVYAQFFLEWPITMTHDFLLLAGFVLILVVAALLFLDGSSKPPVVPDADSTRDQQLDASASHRHR